MKSIWWQTWLLKLDMLAGVTIKYGVEVMNSLSCFFPVSNFHFVVVRSISSEWRTRAFLMFGLIEMGGWGVGGGGVGKMISSRNDIALQAETPHQCVCGNHTLIIWIFKSLKMWSWPYVLQVADIKCLIALTTNFQMYALKTLRIPLQGKHSPSAAAHKNSYGLTRYVCSFHEGDVYRKKACNQFGLSWMCWGNMFLSPLQLLELLARPNPVDHVTKEQQPNANRNFIFGWHVWPTKDKF